MQKLRITHYHTKIKYLATQTTHTINVLLAPYEIVETLLEKGMHPVSMSSKIRYAVLYREDNLNGLSSSGDITPYIVQNAFKDKKPNDLTFTNEELYTLFNQSIQNLVTNNYDVPRFIADCSDTESKTLEVQNDKAELSAVLKVLQQTSPDYIKVSESFTSNEIQTNTHPLSQTNHIPEDIKSKAKQILDFLKKQDPNMKVESYVMGPDGNIQPLQDTPSPETQPPVAKKEPVQIKGALKELMTKYTKEQLKEIYQNMPRAKLLENYPEEEVKELEEFIK